MGATEAEWRTLGVSSPLAKGSPGLAGEIYSPPCPPPFLASGRLGGRPENLRDADSGGGRPVLGERRLSSQSVGGLQGQGLGPRQETGSLLAARNDQLGQN